jgi:nucleotide-binding universal stress UspA family protein
MQGLFRAIAHPTDFSEASVAAFAHALRIALTIKCPLYILHISPDGTVDWASFPQVRHTLHKWGLMDERENTAAVYAKLGVKVVKAETAPQDPVDGIMQFLYDHPAELIVLATEGRGGLARWLHGSVAEALSRAAKVATLFVPGKVHGFVDTVRGEVRLRRVLIPVDHTPQPVGAIRAITGFVHGLTSEAEERFLHVGRAPPRIAAAPDRPLPVETLHGDVVDAIVKLANDWHADLIGMPTAGRHGFMDAVRGSTTERVLRQAPCPVLAVPP